MTAYFAQLICSVPRKPASPVSGVRNAILSVLLQFKALAAVEPAGLEGRAVAAAAEASAAMQSSASSLENFFIPTPSLWGCDLY